MIGYRKLVQGDVKRGDRVRFAVGDSIVQGVVTDTAADGGVVGIEIAGLPYSAALPYVEMIDENGVAL